MNKSDLIEELKDPAKSSYEVLIKGYLNHFDMDQDVWAVLLNKITGEAKQIWSLVTETSEADQALLDSVDKKIKDLWTVVHSGCYDELRDISYIADSLYLVEKKVNKSQINKLTELLAEGYEFLDDNADGNLEIIDFMARTVFKEKEMTTKSILKDWGVDIDSPLYPLFFFGFIPQKDLVKYKMMYCFSKHFKF